MHRIVLTTKAGRECRKLPQGAVIFIMEALDGLSKDPFSKSLDVKKLKAPFEGFRLRVGEWRILYVIEGQGIMVYSIKNRKDAYK
jgi:mRNA-degrading endonuclease RelE of RelBE toxin-antitoxin system